MERNYQMDNVKAVLIFCVVFGHLLELFGGLHQKFLYLVIYSFHMPAFAYTTGYFARPNLRRAARHILYPYLVYQTLYLLFQRCVLHLPTVFQYTTPYWILWYLMAYFFWTLLLPLFAEVRPGWRLGVIGLVLALALLAGGDPTVGRTLSISRMLAFLPFFLLGYYRIPEKLLGHLETGIALGVSGGLVLLSVALIWRKVVSLPMSAFYQADPYFAAGRFCPPLALLRALSMAVAFVWILFLQTAVPRRRLRGISTLGKYTMPVFLLHGFVVKWLQMRGVFRLWGEPACVLAAACAAALLCALLGNPVTYRIFRLTFSLPARPKGQGRPGGEVPKGGRGA